MTLKSAKQLAGRRSFPVLIINGESDEYVDLAEARRLFDAIGEPKRMIVIPPAGHSFRGVEEKIVEVTLEWLNSLR